MPRAPAIILFDAECLLCSANARFVLRHDRAARFRLAAMRGEAGIALCQRFAIDPADPETLLLVENGRARRDSDAVLAIWAGLGWPWRILALGRIVPRPLRDRVYRWVARNRYRLFGRRKACWVPDADMKGRIL